MVGVARYVPGRDDRKAAEVAVLVDDRWQGRGVGRALLRALARSACAHGVERFSALLLVGNRPATRLFARRHLRHVRDGPTVELEVDVRALIADAGSATPCNGAARSMQRPRC